MKIDSALPKDGSRCHHLPPLESTTASATNDTTDNQLAATRYPSPIAPQYAVAAAVNGMFYFVPYNDTRYTDTKYCQSYLNQNEPENPKTADETMSSNNSHEHSTPVSFCCNKPSALDSMRAHISSSSHELKLSSLLKTKRTMPKSSTTARLYIDEIHDLDVLCGRGGRSNHHYGNKRYRQVINETKLKYKNTDGKLAKTGLSRTIVAHVNNYGGRFIKREEKTGKYYVLTPKEAQRKTSQALRELKEILWM